MWAPVLPATFGDNQLLFVSKLYSGFCGVSACYSLHRHEQQEQQRMTAYLVQRLISLLTAQKPL